MENNQEHKIDKVFKHSLDNQSVTPPADAWMAVHTYTIGQEESKKRVWLRYASLGLLVLLFSGLWTWYFIDNQTIVGKNKLTLLSHELNERENAGRVLNPDSVDKFAYLKDTQVSHKLSEELNGRENAGRVLNPASVEKFAYLKNNQNTPVLSQELDSIANAVRILNPDSIESLAYSNDNLISSTSEKQIENIESKPLILNDLSDKMQKESEKKIVILEENVVDKKEVYKADSVAYGKRFSLKHPILNFRLGLFNTSVNINGNNPFNSDVINPNSIYGFSGIIGIAWKLNKKSRISLNAKFVSYSAVNAQSKSAAAYVDPLSPRNKPTGTFKYNGSRDFYEYLTPFGYLTQPVDPKFSFTPKDFNVWLSGKFSVLQIGANYEHDLIAFRHKKGGIPAMEIYGLVGLNIQKIRKYSYSYSLFKNYDPKDNVIFYAPTTQPIYTQSSLENGSPIIFGYNTGLGIRFQLSKGFGLNILGNYESNINSWVKDLPFTTRLSVLSVEGGFFVNL